MGATVKIVTPEQVEVTYDLAGVGARFIAALIDHLILGLGTFVLLLATVAALLGGALGAGGLGDPFAWGASVWVVALLSLLTFAFIVGYFIYFETRWNGQTPGKRAAGIRVIRDSGFPIDFRTAVIRNLLRLVDWLPGGYGVGLGFLLFTRDYQRVGDLAGGTIVVKINAAEQQGNFAERLEQALPQEPLVPVTAAPQLPVYTLAREDYQAVRHYLDRRPELPEELRAPLAERLAEPLLERLGIQRPEPWSAEEFLADLAAEYELHRRR